MLRRAPRSTRTDTLLPYTTLFRSRRRGAPAGAVQERDMSFNPLAERGIPLERQFRNWSELNVQPYDTRAVHPYTRCRVIAMNGIEEIGRAHVCTPVTNAQLVCRLLLKTKKRQPPLHSNDKNI